MGIQPPRMAAASNPILMEYAKNKLQGKKVDRIFMYNPDAIAQWIYEKYSYYTNLMKPRIEVEVPLYTVMPSVTPVCFGTMYTGAQPDVHGIKAYVKPVIKIDTIFDALIRAGKKVAVITYEKCSISRIFLERDMDYFHYEDGDIAQVNAKAYELILKDEHDFIVIYNGNYDSVMHKNGPESLKSLSEIRANGHAFSVLSELVKEKWKNHNVLMGFAMDHGCHEIDGGCGSHGLDMEEDLNIVHLYKGYKRV
jgi:predicted AlkP superfamily pyrophosphatase or phosphodiesterase